MLKASDITEAGIYWYWDLGQPGSPATAVEVGDIDMPRADWEVRWFGRDDSDLLRDLPGAFAGPVIAPRNPPG